MFDFKKTIGFLPHAASVEGLSVTNPKDVTVSCVYVLRGGGGGAGGGRAVELVQTQISRHNLEESVVLMSNQTHVGVASGKKRDKVNSPTSLHLH